MNLVVTEMLTGCETHLVVSLHMNGERDPEIGRTSCVTGPAVKWQGRPGFEPKSIDELLRGRDVTDGANLPCRQRDADDGVRNSRNRLQSSRLACEIRVGWETGIQTRRKPNFYVGVGRTSGLVTGGYPAP